MNNICYIQITDVLTALGEHILCMLIICVGTFGKKHRKFIVYFGKLKQTLNVFNNIYMTIL